MSTNYKGIELDLPKGPVAMSHSRALDMIKGESSTQNMDWTDVLSDIPWGLLKNQFFSEYVETGNLFSLIHMDYQVCNGGISQYFFNGYDNARDPQSEHDVERYDLDDQKRAFYKLVSFGRRLFPEREDENAALSRAADAFYVLSYERDARVEETVYCEEDEYIYDEESGTRIENPDYFEPYEEYYYDDVIHGDDNFDDIFYAANEYMEELFELQAQYICKSLARELEHHAEQFPEAAKAVREIMPDAAYKKPSLMSQIQAAGVKAAAQADERTVPQKEAGLEI